MGRQEAEFRDSWLKFVGTPADSPGMSAATSPKGAQDAETPLRPRAERAPLVHSVNCRFAGADEFLVVSTRNISQSGMLISAPALPAIGSELEFKFILETGIELLSGKGRVVRHELRSEVGPVAGIVFTGLEPPKQRILARVVELNNEPAEPAGSGPREPHLG